MALTANDIITVCQTTVADTGSGVFWTPTGDWLPYLNQAIRWACGLKWDLYTIRSVVTLVAGNDQTIPADGHAFMDAHWNGLGNAVFIRPMDEVKHSKFNNSLGTATANIRLVSPDPRDPKRYHVFPQALNTATLEILYAAIPSSLPLTTTSATYPLGDETQDCVYNYMLNLAYRKNTDRRDLDRAEGYRKAALEWLGLRTQIQGQEDPRPD